MEPDHSQLPFPTAESRPPPTPLTTTTDSSLRSPMKVPPSTPRHPRVDTVTPLPSTLLPTTPLLTLPSSLLTPLPTDPSLSAVKKRERERNIYPKLPSQLFIPIYFNKTSKTLKKK